jgi:hypothetical protein
MNNYVKRWEAEASTMRCLRSAQYTSTNNKGGVTAPSTGRHETNTSIGFAAATPYFHPSKPSCSAPSSIPNGGAYSAENYASDASMSNFSHKNDTASGHRESMLASSFVEPAAQRIDVPNADPHSHLDPWNDGNSAMLASNPEADLPALNSTQSQMRIRVSAVNHAQEVQENNAAACLDMTSECDWTLSYPRAAVDGGCSTFLFQGDFD